MLEKIEINCQSSIKIKSEKVIYFDPLNIEKKQNDADIIFITHSHFDHFSPKDILKIKNENTKIVIPQDIKNEVEELGFKSEDIIVVQPNNKYEILGIEFETIHAYNINKNFHPKSNNWVGYIVNIENDKYYIAGDTDITEENINVKCDYAFVPIGGTYTMNYKEAAELINKIKPKVAVPTHYGDIVGNKEDAIEFKKLIEKDIDVEIIKNET